MLRHGTKVRLCFLVALTTTMPPAMAMMMMTPYRLGRTDQHTTG
jgi:hypothetical protein